MPAGALTGDSVTTGDIEDASPPPLSRRPGREAADEQRRLGAISVRVDVGEPLLLRPGHDRPGVADRAAADLVVPEQEPGPAAADPLFRHAVADQRGGGRGDRA